MHLCRIHQSSSIRIISDKDGAFIYSELQSNVPQLKAILGFVLGFIFVAGLLENCCKLHKISLCTAGAEPVGLSLQRINLEK
ncbi:hypothetical protein [Nostoc sp. NMS4]|uniref:hypothetical protein n=1 Tax=Nostoc sp. NMS4 TaxID=2815390 RepID=UPI0025F1969A|nr:hypothetical protein [Nostoc sp. NMS4]MBN3924203.1 hypothetical protein [Nostoc sp. NMS4]